MGKVLKLEHELAGGNVYLKLEPRPPGTSLYNDKLLPRLLVDLNCKTGQVVGYDSFGFWEDYPVIIEGLIKKPVPGPFDVPELGLKGVNLKEVYEEIHRRYAPKYRDQYLRDFGLIGGEENNKTKGLFKNLLSKVGLRG
jgi:hypothetical protein